MIVFKLELGPAHLAALQHIAAGDKEEKKTYVTENTRSANMFITGVKLLKAERLVTHHHDPEAPLGQQNYWRMTEKGWLVYRIIQLELRDQQRLYSRIGGAEARGVAKLVAPARKGKTRHAKA